VGKTIKYDFTLFVAGVAGEKGSFDSIFNLNILFMQSSFRGQLNLLTRNDPYMGCTAPLASKHCILYIYSTNIGTEYFKHVVYPPFFFSSICSLFHNANFFGACIIHILYTGCAKIEK
jgi:hypothetical protein